MDLVEGDGKKFDAIELYSCFPCVPKMARRTLGLGARRAADGDRRAHLLRRAAQHLHDACGLRDGAQAARRRQARPALRPGRLCHQASRRWCCRAQAPKQALEQDTSVQAEADRNRRTVPEFVTEAAGKGKVESFTVIYGGNGEVEHGVVMLRTEDDARALARVPASDGATLAHLLQHGPHAGGLGRRYRHGRGWRAGVAGGVGSMSRRGAAAEACSAADPRSRAQMDGRPAQPGVKLRAACKRGRRDAPTPSRPASPTPSPACPWRRRRRRGPGRRRRCRPAAR